MLTHSTAPSVLQSRRKSSVGADDGKRAERAKAYVAGGSRVER